MGIRPPIASPDKLRFIDSRGPLGPLAVQYLQAMLRRERERAQALVWEAVDSGVPIPDIYLRVFQPVQYEIGRLWESGQISVGHEHYCTNATQLIMSLLYPRLFSGKRGSRRLLALCVEGELHELGIRMLADFFEMDGWTTDYLGANTPVDGVVRALDDITADAVAVGVTMSAHLDATKTLISAIRRTTDSKKTTILVGGFALLHSEELWRELGADGTARDARQALTMTNQLIEQR